MDGAQTPTDFAIRGAKVIGPDGIDTFDVTVANGVIVDLGDAAAGMPSVDGRGRFLAPGLIDVHGDAFERQIMPRPGVTIALDAAFLETDRQLAANGITTAYHAMTLSWEPGLRSVTQGQKVLAAIEALMPRFAVDHRVQLRWETFALDAVEVLETALKGPLCPSLAFNDHTSMTMRGYDVSVQGRLFEHDPKYDVCDASDPRMVPRIASSAKRAGMSDADYIDLQNQVWAKRDAVVPAMARVAEVARSVGAPMFSHDDTQVVTRTFYRDLGAQVAEFPMVLPVAEAARAAGDHIIFGAPNALRGGSHIGSLGAADMVEAGLCDALASDYYYPALLGAVARMDAEKRASREKLWSLISTGAAKAAGLHDRGAIAVGQRADMVLVDWPENGPPDILHTWVGGRSAHVRQTASATHA